MSYWNYRPYVSVAEKRAKAEKKLEKLKKKNPDIRPVIINGKTIAQSWWGKSWNLNLERYADYSNRIGRGRSYVRHGAVLDLQIRPGRVESLVQGSRSTPYSVVINIQPIRKKIWQDIKAACAGKIDSLAELLEGKFPKALNEIFTAQGMGLFPSPKEIAFECSCPDWAYMCKHVAATLYGIGARLDDDPGLFFKLRKVTMDDLIQQAVREQSDMLLEKAEKTAVRTIAEPDLSEMFGIDLEENITFEVKPPPLKKAAAKKKTAKKKVAVKRKKSTAKKTATKKKTISTRKRSTKKSPEDQVLSIIQRSRKGVNTLMIKEKTGLEDQKIRNIIFKIHNKGLIERAGRGIYKGKKS